MILVQTKELLIKSLCRLQVASKFMPISSLIIGKYGVLILACFSFLYLKKNTFSLLYF